jgi:hypothetical protein
MTTPPDATSPTLPPHAQLIQMFSAGWKSSLLHAAAEIGLADQLAAGPKTADEVAQSLRLHAPSMHRFMRALASLGILSERDGRRFALTPLGEAMKTGARGSARGTMLAFGGAWMTRAWEEVRYSLATGKTAFEKVHGMPAFDYLAQHPDIASNFSQAMVGFHGAEPPAVAEAYDFSPFATVVDVGGATGHMLATILKHHAAPRGILFDMPHVVRDAPALLESRGVAKRVTIEAGSFFERVPTGGDAYILSHVIHDWSEEQCLAILGNCRKAMKPTARLLIVEMVLPAGDAPHPGKVLDMVMLVVPGGQERTEAEYAALLKKAGFRLARVVPTASDASVVEAVPA